MEQAILETDKPVGLVDTSSSNEVPRNESGQILNEPVDLFTSIPVCVLLAKRVTHLVSSVGSSQYGISLVDLA